MILLYLLNDFLIFFCAVIAILLVAARYAPYALIILVEGFFLSGINPDYPGLL